MTERVVERCADCGWSSKLTTPRLAAHALRSHSCEKHRATRAAYERGLARHAKVDRTPKPCLHKRAAHVHGTYACYVLDRCKCTPCSAANSAYESNRLRQKAYGREDLVDAEPVREHVRALMESGVGLKRIEQLAGLHGGTICKLLYGTKRDDGTYRPPAARVRKETARRLLAVPVGDVAPGARVDPTGTIRRLGGLLALGWSIQRIADDHGIDRQPLDRALTGAPVLASTAARVREVYEAIGDSRAPETDRRERISASRSRRRAEQAGWPVPAMWDETDIDDPYAPTPSTTAPRRGVDLEEFAFLVGGGTEPQAAARRLGVGLNAIEHAISRDVDCADAARRALAEWRAVA
ncbi:MAG: hypothetical protein NVV66_18150 [Cellulomonas sp.]|uniref:hypothetical protein n=1 Tax=Cellulomonas sp. TaxID=40001 RepID=UPI002582AA0A|nr:hypothetical protein [Cellulomonas sp.]MCR6706519.1 hypothetical protein [Cellulomonas sp.]